MKCPQCLHENPDASRFCGNCAKPLPVPSEAFLSRTKTLLTPLQELSRGSVFAGRYEILEELGEGGMGKVYRVVDQKINEEVALKLIRPEIAADKNTIERFGNEMKLARKIAHRNVCKMYHLSEEAGNHYIVMEYVRGEDLKGMIRMMGQMSPGQIVSIAKQVCKGLAEAHNLGVIHRDLKPQNIMIDRGGNVRIMDFGLARSLRAKGITGAGIMLGTPEYLSPEQAETKDVDHRTDIYSLGVILYEMVTGRLPFEGETAIGIAMKHKSEIPQNPTNYNPQIPQELSNVILKCMEKDPENRYQSVREIYDELERIEQNFSTSERVVPKKTPITSKELTVRFSMRKLFFPVLAFVAIVIVGVIIWRLLPKEETIPFPSDKPSLAVMYFKNNTGDESLDHWRSALSDLLITDLSQSRYIRILSGESLFYILRQLDQEEATTYSSDILKEVATRGRVANILVGSFTRAADKFRINITLQDANSGELLSSESVEGIGEKSFYAMVDELTRKIKANFDFSKEKGVEDIDKEVKTITTSSPEAYKYYSEGRKFHLEAEYMKSLASMQKALKIDPDFAMAYRSAAMSFSNMGTIAAKRKNIEKAFELRYRVSERERYIIEGDYYRTSWRTNDKAMEAYLKLLELYPEDSIGTTNLGILYADMEEWNKAIEHYEMNMQNSPESQFAFWNASEVYAAMGLYDKARETLEEYINNNSDHSRFHIMMAKFLLYQGEFDRALVELDKALSFDPTDPGVQGEVLILKGHTFLLEGNLIKAEEEYLKLDERGRDTERRTSLALLYLLQGQFKKMEDLFLRKPVLTEPLGYLYLRNRKPAEAIKAFDELWKTAERTDDRLSQIRVLHAKGWALLEMGEVDEAKNIASELKKLIQEWVNKKDIRLYFHLMGMIELENGEFSKAINSLEKAWDLLYAPNDSGPAYHALFLYSLAQAYDGAGNLDKAEEELKKIISLEKGRLDTGDFYAKSFYMLGKIYEKKDFKTKAIEFYEKFLNLWKDADLGLPEAEDARKRLAGLK
jgi:serine/threonine protein kinase/predicted Zn-dependent protease